MKNRILINITTVLFFSLCVINTVAQTTNRSERNRVVLGGFNYQIQEFQLLNQQVGDDCNCLEGSRLNKRSIQSYSLSVLKLKQNWAWNAALGYGFGYGMNDDKAYSSIRSLQTRVDLLYHFQQPENKLRPFIGAGIQWAFNANSSLLSLPIGAGLRYRLPSGTYLHVQTAYDYGITRSIAPNLITQVGIHFNLGKSGQRSATTVTKPIVPDASAALAQNGSDNKTASANPANTAVAATADPAKPADSTVAYPAAKPAMEGLAAAITPADKGSADVQTTPVQTPPQLAKVVYFDTDKSSLNKSGTLETLLEVIAFAKKYPSSQLLLSGHTDNVLDQTYNLALSKRRVHAVKQWLLQQGIAASRIKTTYSGKIAPANTNETPEGRAANRRVEIVLK